jgi:microcin C transport system ATP-binding protein
VVVMKDGDILESGPVHEVLNAPRQDYTRTLVAAAS